MRIEHDLKFVEINDWLLNVVEMESTGLLGAKHLVDEIEK